ncbi:MAG TPA: alpha/beta hydrolase-fold protein [Verrucomicrobiae bacterium]
MKFPLVAAFVCLLISDGFAAEAVSVTSTNAAVRRRVDAPIRSPEISADRKVTFRLRAPKANEVALQGQWKDGRATMTKGTNDVWSVTVGPIEAGIWEYSFNVDGLTMIDPGNTWIKPQREPRSSILHVVGEPPKIWDFQDVPHGTVHSHTYRSKAVGRLREMAVYTPPGYEHGTKKYPLLVLQHGSGDNQATWVVHGKAHWIIDNLIAQKKGEPMVVVMLDGHAGSPGLGGNNTEMFEKDLLEDVLPFVEETYRVKKGPENRGIVGLSMGGGQSLTVGLKHLDKFAWVGGFSSATPNKETVEKTLTDPNTNKKLKLLWIGVGKDDFLLKRNEEFVAMLKENNIKHEWDVTEGNHSWPVWRNYLAVFVPKLFH